MTPLRDDIVAELKQKPMTAMQLANAVGTRQQVVQVALTKLCDAGTIRRHGFSAPPRPSILFEFCQPQSKTGANE